MPFTQCNVVIERVNAMVEGEFGWWMRSRFHLHLWICPPCMRYYKQFLAIKEAAGEVKPADLPEDFEKVMHFVLEELDLPAAGDLAVAEAQPPKKSK